jgi:hypothetical protein
MEGMNKHCRCIRFEPDLDREIDALLTAVSDAVSGHDVSAVRGIV